MNIKGVMFNSAKCGETMFGKHATALQPIDRPSRIGMSQTYINTH